MSEREIIGYFLTFRIPDRESISLSVEGGQQLMQILSDPACPRFIPVKDSMIAVTTIDQLVPIYRPQPTVNLTEPIKPMTPEQRVKHEKRMAEFHAQFGIVKKRS